MEREGIDINIWGVLLSIKKRWMMILGIILLLTSLTAIYSFFIADPIYKTTTKLFIGKNVSDSKTDEYDVNEVSMFQKLMQTYAGFAKAPDLIDKAMEESNIDLTSEYILKKFTVTTGQEDQFLTFEYESEDRDEGVRVLEAITSEFMNSASRFIPNGTVEIVETPKYPKEAFSPNEVKNILFAFIIAIVLGIGLIFILEYLDNTVKSREEIEKILNVPIIGIVPEADNETTDSVSKVDKDRRRSEYSA